MTHTDQPGKQLVSPPDRQKLVRNALVRVHSLDFLGVVDVVLSPLAGRLHPDEQGL
jgi:hypothetical protein